MSECFHKNLVLFKERTDKIRCKTCHLTLSPDELKDDYCPECYENTGRKQYDFEQVESTPSNISRYRCADCGTIIEATEKDSQ